MTTTVRVDTIGMTIGRNGRWDITAIEVEEWMNSVSINGVGKRGTIIQSSGIHSVPAEKMDELCAKWLAARPLEARLKAFADIEASA